MLTGCYFNTIDSKGRALIPNKLRYRLGERIWLVKGIDKCLYIFTQEEWLAFTDRYLNNLTLKDAKSRMLQRFILGGSREIEIDGQGRINLPQDHIDYAGINKDAVFVGCGKLVELWAAEEYEKATGPDSVKPDELMRDATETVGEE
ncbi:MAG: division/cell wall cluster transcriptional repressor MraZ [Clostridiales bacterium]|nr:division/cell wall cluster transcriptional repressor MraZ [Clostridiales bacterium]